MDSSGREGQSRPQIPWQVQTGVEPLYGPPQELVHGSADDIPEVDKKMFLLLILCCLALKVKGVVRVLRTMVPVMKKWASLDKLGAKATEGRPSSTSAKGESRCSFLSRDLAPVPILPCCVWSE